MNQVKATSLQNFDELSKTVFDGLASLIYQYSGIKLPPLKKSLLESRLQKRLKANNLISYKDYFEYVKSEEGMSYEFTHMIDAVTTNKTDFFREQHHFDFLIHEVVPKHARNNNTPLRIWSAACSTGEEPYSIAITLEECKKHLPDLGYSIIASDLSTSVLKKAVEAIYSADKIGNLADKLKRVYFLKSKNQESNLIRLIPAIRKRVHFMRLNLMDSSYHIDHDLDVIFCRNALIYFDRETQMQVVSKLISHLKPGGYFIIGHSESLLQHSFPLLQVKPTIYQKSN